MAYNEGFAERVQNQLDLKGVAYNTKKMFGGLCFMVNNKMCIGVEKERLMLRLHPDQYDSYLEQEGAAPMEFTGRPMKGYIWLYEEGFNTKKKLQYWIEEALQFNPLAKASKKKK